MKTAIFFIFVFISGLASGNIKPTIICHTSPYTGQSFVIYKNKVVYLQKEKEKKRRPASFKQVKTKLSRKGFDKFLFHQGEFFRIHVQDTTAFSWVNDYLEIKNQKGEVSHHPLDCGAQL